MAASFLEVFFPDVVQRRRESALERLRGQLMQTLSPLGPQPVTIPTGAETGGAAAALPSFDPAQQLRQMGQADITATLGESPGIFNQQELQMVSGLLASPVPEARQFGQAMLSQAFPQAQAPTSQQKNVSAILELRRLGRKEEADLLEQIVLKPQTQVSIGDVKPLGGNASKWRDAQGNQPDPRLTITQAAEAGFAPQTTDQQKAAQAATEAAPIFADLIRSGFGSEGQESLFPSEKESALTRTVSGAKAWLAGKTDSDLRVSLYNSASSAVVTGLARLVGNVGTLTDRDVDTVRGLMPIAGLTPKPVAEEKFRQIASLLKAKGVSEQQLKQMGFPEWALTPGTPTQVPPPPAGFK